MTIMEQSLNIASNVQPSTIVDVNNIQYSNYANIIREADIFSDLPKDIFHGNDEMAITLNLFKKAFYNRINLYKDVVVFPKLKYVVEGDERMVILPLLWNNGNATIYFSFDKEGKHNFVGYSMNDTVNNEFLSNTKDINDSNRDRIINSIIDLICEIG